MRRNCDDRDQNPHHQGIAHRWGARQAFTGALVALMVCGTAMLGASSPTSPAGATDTTDSTPSAVAALPLDTEGRVYEFLELQFARKVSAACWAADPAVAAAALS